MLPNVAVANADVNGCNVSSQSQYKLCGFLDAKVASKSFIISNSTTFDFEFQEKK